MTGNVMQKSTTVRYICVNIVFTEITEGYCITSTIFCSSGEKFYSGIVLCRTHLKLLHLTLVAAWNWIGLWLFCIQLITQSPFNSQNICCVPIVCHFWKGVTGLLIHTFTFHMECWPALNRSITLICLHREEMSVICLVTKPLNMMPSIHLIS